MIPFVILASEAYTREACHELSMHGLHNACMQNAAVRFSRQCDNEKAELAPRTSSYSGRLRVPSVSAVRCCRSVAQHSFVSARFKQCHWLGMRGISDRRLKACCSTGEHVIVVGPKHTWLVFPLQRIYTQSYIPCKHLTPTVKSEYLSAKSSKTVPCSHFTPTLKPEYLSSKLFKTVPRNHFTPTVKPEYVLGNCSQCYADASAGCCSVFT